MPSTWRVRTLRTSADGDRPYGTEGLFGIVNNSTDIVEVRKIQIQSPSGIGGFDTPTTPTEGVGRYRLKRITAMSGGESIAPVKHDTNSADLPAAVLVRLRPSVTDTSTFRALGDTPGLLHQTALGAMVGGMVGGMRPGADLDASRLFGAIGDSGVQRIVLNPGEGAAIMEAENHTCPHLQMGEIIFRNQATGATYAVATSDMATREAGGFAALAVFNGSGSGVVLEVIYVGLPDMGSGETVGTEFSHYWIGFIGGMLDGDSLVAVPHDTGNDALPDGIQIKKNFSFNNAQRQAINPMEWMAINASQTQIVNYFHKNGLLRCVYRSPYEEVQPMKMGFVVGRTVFDLDPGIKLRKGQGIAIGYGWDYDFQSHRRVMQHTFNNLDISCEFNVEVGEPSDADIAEAVWSYGNRTLTA